MSELTENSKQNYETFLEQVVASNVVWGIANENGWAACESEDYDEASVIPFWSSKEYAEAYIKFEWPRYQPKQISLQEFIENWLPGMDEDGVYVGINWCEKNNDLEMESLVLLDDLDGEE